MYLAFRQLMRRYSDKLSYNIIGEPRRMTYIARDRLLGFKGNKMETKTCYARGFIQYVFTILFGMVFFGFILVILSLLFFTNVLVGRDFYGSIIAGIFGCAMFLYWFLACLFYKVKVVQNKIVYTNRFNKTMYIDPKDIKGITDLSGRGICIKVNGKRIIMCSYYENYNEVSNAILYLFSTSRLLHM